MCSHDWGKQNILGKLNNKTILDIWLSENAKKSRKNLYKADRNFEPSTDVKLNFPLESINIFNIETEEVILNGL